MLDLLNTYAGSPSTGLQHLVLAHNTLILYPSADSVVILDARTLRLVHVLAFWEVFPGMRHTKEKVNCVSVDSGMKLIVASMNSRIAAWSLSGIQNDTWRVHSSLVLPDSQAITTLDNKSGLLAVGSQNELSVYTLILENDLPTWSLKWTSSVPTPFLTRFAPSLMYIVSATPNDNGLRTYSTTSGRQTQIIFHPRPVNTASWRHSQKSSRDDLILYTITSDSTLRIFLPVLDSPQHLQLHAAVDLFSALQFSASPATHDRGGSNVFWLDREIISDSLSKLLSKHSEQDDAQIRRIKEVQEEGWDLFLRTLEDGSIIINAVANIDRRPPTLLRQFTLQQLPPSTIPSPPSHFYILPHSNSDTITIVTTPPLVTFNLSPVAFFDAQSEGLFVKAQSIEQTLEEGLEIARFVRTPEGKGVGVIRTGGAGDVWRLVEHGSKLSRAGTWPAADLVVPLASGEIVVTYSQLNTALTLHTEHSQTLIISPVDSLFSLPSDGNTEHIMGITSDLSIVHVHVHVGNLILYSENSLPLALPPKMILPVDPMAWSAGNSVLDHDVLLSVSETGELAFWVPENGDPPRWRCTGQVLTKRTGIKMAKCSSVKKTALVVSCQGGEELTIWDSHESEFASGLEYSQLYSVSETINDLDWSSTPDNQSILAVGFAHHVDLLCQQRMTYFDEEQGWTVLRRVTIGNLTPYAISDSIWLAHGSLLIGAGHQMFLYGQPAILDQQTTSSESLFEQVARQNGPLPDYHPQMILQCLLWDKVELVKTVVVNLARNINNVQAQGRSKDGWMSIPVENFMKTDQVKSVQKKRYTLLFNGPTQEADTEEEEFSRPLVVKLLESLEEDPLPHLTPNEQAHLLVLIQTALEIDEQRRALDSNGLRYLISMRSFYILNRRASAPNSPQSHGGIPRQSGWRERLRYRDIVWAFHSESQDLLLHESTTACSGKMTWSDAKALGVSMWLTSVEILKSQLEVIARNEYTAGDNRDPTACSLLYFALGKVKLVHGLWRQAAWHGEQTVMLKFLSNDFTQPRWRTAALKNAFALLSKRRFEYAAAFFLLGNSLKDAVNVCVKQLSDFQLAIALARAVEQSNEGPIFLDVLESTVLPIAFRDGNRWLGSWAFWLLHRRDLAVRILLTPLQDVASSLTIRVTEIGEPHYDDPSLALLFSQLKSKTLQAAQGTSEISGRAEFNFVLQIARVFCRMGCHVLALDLVRSWSFERPSTAPAPLSSTRTRRVPSPNAAMLAMGPAMRRRSSIMIDMAIPSLPPTRPASPDRGIPAVPPPVAEDSIQEEGDLFARKAGLGSLMKSARKDQNVPEFDMSSFF